MNATRPLTTLAITLLPARWLALCEYYARPGLQTSWGGAFNGQCWRQVIFLDLDRTFEFDAIVETGTFRGTTTEYFLRNTRATIYTVEAAPRFFLLFSAAPSKPRASLHEAGRFASLSKAPRYGQRACRQAGILLS
jgi:hypothetical protein